MVVSSSSWSPSLSQDQEGLCLEWAESYDREEGEGGLQRPKLEMNIKYNKDEEKARLKELLREGPARLCE